MERVSKDRVCQVVDFLEKNLNIPNECLKKAADTEVNLVDRDTFLEVVKRHFHNLGYETPEELVVDESKHEKMDLFYGALGTSYEEVSAKHSEAAQKFNDNYLATPGISICIDEDKSVVFINKDEIDNDWEMNDVLAHELLHSMADKTELESGFSIDGNFHYLNEAMVQLMVVRAKNSGIEWSDFVDRYLAGKIENGHYHKQVSTLLALIKSTSFGIDGLYSFDDLIHMYFDQEYDGGIRGTIFKMNLARKIPQKLGDNENFGKELMDLFENRLE